MFEHYKLKKIFIRDFSMERIDYSLKSLVLVVMLVKLPKYCLLIKISAICRILGWKISSSVIMLFNLWLKKVFFIQLIKQHNLFRNWILQEMKKFFVQNKSIILAELQNDLKVNHFGLLFILKSMKCLENLSFSFLYGGGNVMFI